MKQLLSVLGLFCVIGLPITAFAQNAPIGTEGILIAFGANTVEGTLMKIEGDYYVIMDSAGTEQRGHVDGRTLITGNITPGAKVKAEVTDEGHASALQKVDS